MFVHGPVGVDHAPGEVLGSKFSVIAIQRYELPVLYVFFTELSG